MRLPGMTSLFCLAVVIVFVGFAIAEQRGPVISARDISGYFDEGLRWWYDIAYVANGRCTDVALRLRHDDPGSRRAWGGQHLIPTTRDQRINLCAP